MSGRLATTAVGGLAGIVLIGGIWVANRAEGDEAAEPTEVDRATTTTEAAPPETMLVVTLPPATSSTTSSTTPTTAGSTTTIHTTVAPYQTAEEQVEHFTTGVERERLIADLTALTPYMVSVDELAARHDIMPPINFKLDGDGKPELVEQTPRGIVVSLTSEFRGDEAVGEEAWTVVKYFAPLWAVGEPIRHDVPGYWLEVNIGRHTYLTTPSEMAEIADVRLGFAEWEQAARL